MVISQFVKIKLIVEIGLRGAERIWPPSTARGSVAVPNGEGVASGSATLIYLYHGCIYIINASTSEE